MNPCWTWQISTFVQIVLLQVEAWQKYESSTHVHFFNELMPHKNRKHAAERNEVAQIAARACLPTWKAGEIPSGSVAWVTNVLQ